MKDQNMLSKETLKIASYLQRKGEKVMRYKENPHVEGDSVIEHTLRATKIALYALPSLLNEFKIEQGKLKK